MNNTTLGSLVRKLSQACLLLIPFSSLAQPTNDLCSGAVPISQEPVCSPNPGTLVDATYTAMTSSCESGTQNDVWYSFVAKSVQVQITFNPNTTPPGLRYQLYSAATCGGTEESLTGCNLSGSTVSNLLVGTTYLIRVFSNTNVPAPFTICVTTLTQNSCGSAQLVLPNNPAPTQGYMAGSTADAPAPGPTCGTGYDVWYRFVASTTNPTVNLSNIGVDFINPSLEVFSGACASRVSIGCGTTSVPLTGLTLGTTYYIRVYSPTGPVPTNRATSSFNIAVTEAAPDNDLAANAQNLSVAATCTNVFGTLKTATSSIPAEGVPAGCNDPNAADVWYRFTPTGYYAQISISGAGGKLTAATGGNGIRLQFLEGVPGAFNQIACATTSYNTNTLGRTLVPGQTYYIRVSTANAITGPIDPTNNAYRFAICITEPAIANTAPRFGNTYVNLSKKNVGGVVEQGDTLEIRMTIALTSGIQFNPRYVDNVPTNTQMLTGPTDSLRIITNEGLPYKEYSLAAGDDAATYLASPPSGEYNIRINMGFGAGMPHPTAPLNNGETDATGSFQMTHLSRPLGGNRLLFSTAFRVVVTGNPGDVITLGSGKFLYRNSPSSADLSVSTTPYQILITTPRTLCANATGINQAQEFGGTFGEGTTLNRPTNIASVTSYTYVPDMGGTIAIGDGHYGIVKSTSAREGTSRNAEALPNCILPVAAGDMNSCYYRMYSGHWDVDGDHGGTNDALGALPPATDANGGYMMVVNADYVASEIYSQTITGLCPNTYYEFSSWLRNICPNCGVDSTAAQTYRPGVLPNLTFTLDNIDQYNTGEIEPNGWQKKGFVFVTGPSQTSATFSIRNNAQGGGGNDWAIDDISIATCLPNMSYSPTLNPSVCIANDITVHDTVRSIYNNYGHHQWQKSMDGGSSWANVGIQRDSTPVWNAASASYQYVTSLTIPPEETTLADSGTLYRVIVATTADNVGEASCQVTDGISIINLAVLDCIVLPTDLLSFAGRLIQGNAYLSWTTSREQVPAEFLLERSNDGINFSPVTRLSARNNGAVLNDYAHTDPTPAGSKTFYRVALITVTGNRKYSKVIQLSGQGVTSFALTNVINPFQSSLHFELSSPVESRVQVALVDMFGNTVKRQQLRVSAGINSFTIPSTEGLPAGTYVLMVNKDNQVLHRKVVKRN